MFPRLRPQETFAASSFARWENISGSNVSATMVPRLRAPLQQVNLGWTGDPIENKCLVSGQLKKRKGYVFTNVGRVALIYQQTWLLAQSVEQRWSNPKVVGSIPTLVRVFLCPCVGPVPSVGITLTWFIWVENLHFTLHFNREVT